MGNRRNSLSRDIVLNILLLALTLMGGAILVISIYAYGMLKKDIKAEANLILSQGAMAVNQFMERQFSLLQTLALDRGLRGAEIEKAKAQVELFLSSNPQFNDLRLISSSGKELIFVSRYEYLSSKSLHDYSEDAHFKQALSGKRSQGEIIFESGRPSVAIAVPVRANPAEINDALEASLDMRFLSDWIEGVRLERKGALFIADRESTIIAHSEPRFALGGISARSLPPVAESLAGREVVPYGTGSRYTNLKGRKVVAGALPLSGEGWVIVEEMDERDLLIDSLPLPIMVTAVAFLTLLLASLWAIFLLRRRVVQPVTALAQAVEDFEKEGNFTPPAIESKDEISLLSESLSKMTENLSSTLKELSLSQSRLSTTLENIPQGVLLLDPAGLIEYANQIVAGEFKNLPGDFLGRDVRKLMVSTYWQRFDAEWAKMRKERAPFSFEMEYLTGRGKYEPGLLFVAPLSGTEGGFSGAVLLGVNLTKVKEEELRKTREERLAFLGLLASKVSHELRNPLGAMSNTIYYLKMNLKNSDEKILRHLEILDHQVENSNRLITSILDFARPKEPVFYPVGLNQVLKQALESVPLPQGIEMEQTLDQNLPAVQGDAQQLMQVFINLLTNACQAMPQGGKVLLRTRLKDAMEVAEVQDTGQGIDLEFMKNLFKPFHSGKAKGMGLGLTISKDIVEKHGGRIEVQSQPGQGTTFSVYLPLKDKEK